MSLVYDTVVLAACGKRRVCHPEPVSFAGEGSAVRKKAKEKADSEPRSKTERGSERHIFEFFRSLGEQAQPVARRLQNESRRGEVDSAGGRGRSESDSTAGRRRAGQNLRNMRGETG